MRFTTILWAASALALTLAVGTGNAGSVVPDSKLKRELDAQLPPESRHTFLPVSEKWIKTLRFVDPVRYEEHKPEVVSEEQKKRFDKKEVLSVSGKEEGDRRVLTHSPDGKLRSIGDWRGDDEFTQDVYANGSIGQYMHRRKEKVLEAYSVSPRGNDVHRVVRGNGILKVHSDSPDIFTRVAFHEGMLFFRGAFTGEKLTFVELSVNNSRLDRWRSGSEEFTIENSRTWWGRDSAKGPVKLKRLGGEFDLKKLDPGQVKMWEERYSGSIAGFFDQYDALLKKAGYTWAKLGIEFIPSGKPFPGE